MNTKHIFTKLLQRLVACSAWEYTCNNDAQLSDTSIGGSTVTYIIYTAKNENKIFLIYQEIQMESVAKSHMRKLLPNI
jgi:hypothetical protein